MTISSTFFPKLNYALLRKAMSAVLDVLDKYPDTWPEIAGAPDCPLRDRTKKQGILIYRNLTEVRGNLRRWKVCASQAGWSVRRFMSTLVYNDQWMEVRMAAESEKEGTFLSCE